MPVIPGWLVSILISIAVKFGVHFLLLKMPWIPADVQKIIQDLVDKLTAHKDQKVALVADAKNKIKECSGAACPSDLKGE